VPHLEFWVTRQSSVEHVSEKPRVQDRDAASRRAVHRSRDHVEFSQRLAWMPSYAIFPGGPTTCLPTPPMEHRIISTARSSVSMTCRDASAPALDAQLKHLESYLEAHGTRVGVFANFTSFFDSTLLAVGMTDSMICSARTVHF